MILHNYFLIVSLFQILWIVRLRHINTAFRCLHDNRVCACSAHSVHWPLMGGLCETCIAAWGQCTWWHHSCRRCHGSPKVWHRTCVVFLTTHGNTMNYDVRGSKLADLMMSARRCVASSTVLTLTSTYSVSDVWRHFTLLTFPKQAQHLQDST